MHLEFGSFSIQTNVLNREPIAFGHFLEVCKSMVLFPYVSFFHKYYLFTILKVTSVGLRRFSFFGGIRRFSLIKDLCIKSGI